MNFTYIVETFFKALAGVPVTLGIMVVSILLSFLPALFGPGKDLSLAGGQPVFHSVFDVHPVHSSYLIDSILL